MFGRGAKTDVPYTVIEAVDVLPGKEAEFVDWDRRYEEALADVPGYLSSETLAPAPPEQPEWVITARWASKDDMVRFADSDLYDKFEAEGDTLRAGRSSIEVFEGAVPTMTDPSRAITSVLYWDVPSESAKDFAKWHEKYAQAMSEAPGFQGYQLQEPVEELAGRKAAQPEWVEVVRWSSVFARDAWIRSDTRRKMLEMGEGTFTGFRARNVKTSFEGWFRFDSSTAGSPTPTWKQTMTVLLALYPTVFLLSRHVVPEIVGKDAELWWNLFVGNVISSVILGFLLMPIVTRFLLGWWLNPPPTARESRTWIGVGFVVAGYAIALLIFSQWPKPTP